MPASTPAGSQDLPPGSLEEYRGTSLLVSSIALLIFQAATLAGYTASRRIHKADDGWILWTAVITAYLCVSSVAIAGITGVEIAGMGHHLAYWLLKDPLTITRYLQLQTAVEFLYMGAVTTPKLIICLYYLKIFRDRTARAVTWLVIIILACYFLSGVISGFTICRPFSYKWNKSIDGECDDLMAEYRFISVPSLLTDVIILALPVPTTLHLQVGPLKKFGIFLTFLMGSLGIIMAIVRFVEFCNSKMMDDPPYHSVRTMIMTIAEPSAYFTCGCFLGMRPLLNYAVHKYGILELIRSVRDQGNTPVANANELVRDDASVEHQHFASKLGSTHKGFLSITSSSDTERKIDKDQSGGTV